MTQLPSSFSAASARLEQAFKRLEQAATQRMETHHLLKAEQEKLNLLLQVSDEKLTRLRQMTGVVTAKLDHTISVLEHGASLAPLLEEAGA